MHEANFHRFNGPVPALGAIAEIVSGVLLAWDNPQKATKLLGGRHDGFRRRPGRTCENGVPTTATLTWT